MHTLILLALTLAVFACVRLERSRPSDIATGISTMRYDLVFKIGPSRFIIAEYVRRSGIDGTPHSSEGTNA